MGPGRAMLPGGKFKRKKFVGEDCAATAHTLQNIRALN